MKKVKMLFVSALVGSLLAVSCKKGDTGPTGSTGATGPKGTAGTDSIFYSGPITLAMNPYTDIANDWSGYLDSIAVPALTQAVVDQDIILGYLYVPYGASNDSAWVSIDNATLQEAVILPKVGQLTIESFWTEYSTTSGDGNLTGMKFKFFIVPPSLLTGGSQLTTVEPTDLKRMSYDKAMTVLGIHPTAAGNIVTTK